MYKSELTLHWRAFAWCHHRVVRLSHFDIVQVRTWSEVYSSVIEDTKGYVEKKQASTYEELVAEQELKAEEVMRRFSVLTCMIAARSTIMSYTKRTRRG